MESPDELLEELWRLGLAELAPPLVAPDVARVERRVKRLRLRRATTGAALAMVFVLGAATAVFAAPGDHGRGVRTNDGPTPSSSAGPQTDRTATVGSTRGSGPRRTTTTRPFGVPPTIPPNPSGTGPAAGLPQPPPTGLGSPETTVPTVPAATLAPPSPTSATPEPPTPTTAPPTPTTHPASGSVPVVLTFDDSGLHAAPVSAAVGELDVTFVDNRTNRSGTPTLYLEVHQSLGARFVTGVGGHAHLSLCAHTWFFSVRVNGEGSPDVAWRGFAVDSPECTTPVT